MIFFLSKFLVFIIRPLVWIIAVALYALFSKNKQRKRKALVTAVIVLLLFTNKFILVQVASLYEAKPSTLGHYEIGLLLGGFSSYNSETKSLKTQFSGDRLTQVVKLYHEGTIEKILMSGGSASIFKKHKPEAIYASEYLKAIKIPDSAVLIEKDSRNTKENFEYANKILKDLNKPNARILVITSAWHIPRTKLIAEKQGFKNVDYYPTNSLIDNYSFDDYLIPQSSAMMGWEVLIKEWVGYITTKLGIT